MPYKSAKQRGYFHANRVKLEAQGVNVSEWDSASKGKKLPKRAADGGSVFDDAFSSGSGEPFRENPRRWIDRIPRAQYDTGRSKTIPPGLLLKSRGINPSRKHGDAIDYNSADILSSGDDRYYTRVIKGLADGGEVEETNPWDQLPRSPEGRPQITVTKPPVTSPYEAISGAFSGPSALSPIKPGRPPTQGIQQDPSQLIGRGMRSAGSHYLDEIKELANPFTKENDKYFADQPLPEDAYKGKVPQTQKDPIALGAPVLGEVLGTFAGPPGKVGAVAGLKAVGAGLFGVGAKAAKAATPKMFEHGFLDTSKFVPVGGQKGTMPGGWMHDKATAQDFYVKEAPGLEQAKNEKLTAELYKLFGVDVADVHLTEINGKPGIASKKIEGNQLGNEYNVGDYSGIKGLHENYPIHALLANHDAVGTGPENPLGNIIVKNGKAYVIDTGGGLLYKGTGTPKAKFSPQVDELSTMRDPNYNHLSAEVFGGVSDNVARVGAQRIADTDNLAIAKLVEMYGPSDPYQKQQLMTTLMQRKKAVMDAYSVAPGGHKKPNLKLVPKAEPEPHEQIPFTEEDYAKWGQEAPQSLPDDVAREIHPASKQSYFSFSKLIGDDVTQSLTEGVKFDKGKLSGIANNLLNDEFGQQNHWKAAVGLWQIAEQINPQAAEAIFRNLPVSKQPQVGYAIAALNDSLDYSPFNSIAKGSGKDGKFPSEYDYYSTQTTKFPIPDHLKKSKAFQENIKLYSKTLAKEEPGLFSDEVTESLASKKLMELKGNDPQTIHEYLKGLNDSATSEEIFKGLPKETREAIDKIIEAERTGKPIPKTQYEKDAAEYEAKLDADLDKPFKKIDGLPAYQWFHDAPKHKIDSRLKDVAKPIKNWTEWTPPNKTLKGPPLAHITPEQARGLGFNPKVEFTHGSSSEIPDTLQDPRIYKPEYDERAFFTADEPYYSTQYGLNLKGYLAKVTKAVELDWRKFSGQNGYSASIMRELIEAGHRQGLDMIAAHNMKDLGHGLHTQYLFLKTAGTLRQTIAKFDPNKLHLANTMAGLAGGGTFIYGVSGQKDDSKMKRGGIPGLVHRAKELARGGPGSATQNVRAGSHPRHPAGMIKSSIPGRTDKIPMGVPPGSYILPADVPSALGQGNTMAGEKILGSMFKIGPYGSGATGQIKSGKPQRPNFNWMKTPRPMPRPRAEGGGVGGDSDIPIIAAGGEYVIHPEQVADIGHGNMDAGHRVLDKFVLSVRKQHIDTLKKLKPPKK